MSEAESHTLHFECEVQASPEEVYRAFTRPAALRRWLCDDCQADPRPGGRLYLWWESGYYATGVFNQLEPDAKVAFTWFGREEPGPTQVEVTLDSDAGRTTVNLAHKAVGTGETWAETRSELQRGWRIALENLRSIVETGRDLRELRRPILGVLPAGRVDAREAARLDLPAPGGVRVGDLVPGSGAVDAGLQPGDIITAVGDRSVGDWADVREALRALAPGDHVPITYFREGDLCTEPASLGSAPQPEVPAGPKQLAQALASVHLEANQRMEALLEAWEEGTSEGEPSAEKLEIKETLASLMLYERDLQTRIVAWLRDHRVIYPPVAPERVQAVLAVYPTLQALWDALRRSQGETVALVTGLPETMPEWQKGGYVEMAGELLQYPHLLERRLGSLPSAKGPR